MRFERRSIAESRRGGAVIVMDKFVVPIGFPGLTVVRRKRLLPLCYNLRTFGIHCPGVADDNRYAVEISGPWKIPTLPSNLPTTGG